MVKKLLIIFFVLFIFDLLFTCLRKPPRSGSVRILFGLPGSGKTTFCAYLVKRDLKKGIPVWSNVPILGANKLSVRDDISKFDISSGHLIIDEAGIDYNNRQFSGKNGMSQSQIEWWKLIRHYKVSAEIVSQSYQDMDVTLRRLASDLYIVKKSLIPYFVTVRKIKRTIGIDELQHIPVDMFKMGFPVLDTYRCFMPSVWKLFDSYDAPALPPKNWSKYEKLDSRFSDSEVDSL